MVLFAVAVPLAVLIGLGLLSVVGIVAILRWLFGGKKSTVTGDVDGEWVDLPGDSTTIDQQGVDFKFRVFATFDGNSQRFNLQNQNVIFSGTTPQLTIKTPADGIKATDDSGVAECNFTGNGDGTTNVAVKVKIGEVEFTKSTPHPYEVSRF